MVGVGPRAGALRRGGPPAPRARRAGAGAAGAGAAGAGARACGRCGGSGEAACGQCGGSGRRARGGFQRNNMVKASKLVGSKWTSQQKHLGKDYFVVKELQRLGPKHTVCLVEACTAPERKLWLNIELLKDKSAWAPGWVEGMCRASAAEPPGGQPCAACEGTGCLPCPICSGGTSVYAV